MKYQVVKRDVVPFARNVGDIFDAGDDSLVAGFLAEGAIICLDKVGIPLKSPKKGVKRVSKKK